VKGLEAFATSSWTCIHRNRPCVPKSRAIFRRWLATQKMPYRQEPAQEMPYLPPHPPPLQKLGLFVGELWIRAPGVFVRGTAISCTAVRAQPIENPVSRNSGDLPLSEGMIGHVAQRPELHMEILTESTRALEESGVDEECKSGRLLLARLAVAGFQMGLHQVIPISRGRG